MTQSRRSGLHIKLKAPTPREQMVVAGSVKEMGWWDPRNAAALDWTGEAWETKQPIQIPFDQSQKQLEFKFVRAGEASTWEDGIFHRLDVEAPPEGDLDLLVSGRFNDRVSVQEVTEKATRNRSDKERPRRQNREARLTAAHWRRRFEETQKELFALQREAAAMERQFEEEERQAALEEAALRLQLAKVQGTVEALRKVKEAEALQREQRAERRHSEPSNSQQATTPPIARRGIMTARQPFSTGGQALQRSGSTIESVASSSSSSMPMAPLPRSLRQGQTSIPSLLGPVAPTPKHSSPGFGSTTASSKVSVVQETGYVAQELLEPHFRK